MKWLFALGLLGALAPAGQLVGQCVIGLTAPTSIGLAAGNGDVVALADVNNDGRRDVIAGCGFNTGFTIFLNNGAPIIAGNAGFLTRVAVATASPARGLVVSDFNGDGFIDFAYGAGGSVAVRLGNGTTAPGPETLFTAGTNITAVALGNMNADSRLDLVCADQGGNAVAVLASNGNGTFAAPIVTPVGTGPIALAVSDVNADARLDVLVVNSQTTGNIDILHGNADGTFAAATSLTSSGTTPRGIAVADFSGDGRPDFAVSNHGSNNVSIYRGSTAGPFTAFGTVAMGQAPTTIIARDLNFDGFMDLVVANSSTNSIDTARGLGNTQFTDVVRRGTGNPYYIATSGLASADLSGDNRADIVVAGTGAMTTYYNYPPVPFVTLSGPTCLGLAVGSTFTQTASATGGGLPPTYQWRRNGINLNNGGSVSGALTATLTISPVVPSDTGVYTVAVTGCNSNSVISGGTTLAVTGTDPCLAQVPIISGISPSRTVLAGASATLVVGGTGLGPLTIQWRRDGVPLADSAVYSGVKTPVLTFQPASPADGGAFDCILTNACGSARSDPRALSVVSACNLDFNHDVFIDPDDLGDYITAYYGGACP